MVFFLITQSTKVHLQASTENIYISASQPCHYVFPKTTLKGRRWQYITVSVPQNSTLITDPPKSSGKPTLPGVSLSMVLLRFH